MTSKEIGTRITMAKAKPQRRQEQAEQVQQQGRQLVREEQQQQGQQWK
jgi:hypothetical protein